jgi:hypothetical protein
MSRGEKLYLCSEILFLNISDPEILVQSTDVEPWIWKVNCTKTIKYE